MTKNHLSWGHIRVGEHNLITKKNLYHLVRGTGATVAQVMFNTGFDRLPGEGINENNLAQIAAYASMVGLNSNYPEEAKSEINSYMTTVFRDIYSSATLDEFVVPNPGIQVDKFGDSMKKFNKRTNAQLNGLIEEHAKSAYNISQSREFQAIVNRFGPTDHGLIATLGNATLVKEFGFDPKEYLREVIFGVNKLSRNKFRMPGMDLSYGAQWATQHYSPK